MKPVEQLRYLLTASLAANIMDYLKASRLDEAVKATYVQHLALLVCIIVSIARFILHTIASYWFQKRFVRANPDARAKNFHTELKKWVATFFPDISEEQ